MRSSENLPEQSGKTLPESDPGPLVPATEVDTPPPPPATLGFEK